MTEPTLNTLPAPASPTCDGCGASDAVPTQFGEPLCSACATKYALAYTAADHLRFLLTDALTAFLNTWGHHPHIVRHMDDEAGVIAATVMDELLAARLGAVQAAD